MSAARQIVTTGNQTEQPQIRCRTGQHIERAALRDQPIGCCLQHLNRLIQSLGDIDQHRIIRLAAIISRLFHLANIGFDGVAIAKFTANQIHRLNTICAFINRQNTRIAHKLRRAGFFNKAHAAMNLHTQRSHLIGDVGAEGFRDRRQQIILGFRFGVARGMRQIGHHPVFITNGPRRIGQRAHGQKHTPHIGVIDDGDRIIIVFRGTRFAPLLALLGIGQCVLRRGLSDTDTLQADMQPRIIHHGKHAGHAAMLRANQPAGCAACGIDIFAKRHDTSRAGVNTKFFFKADAFHIIGCTQRAVIIDHEFRHNK